MIKAVIFDYDGVIVDSLEVVRKVYAVLGQELGVPEWTQLGEKIDSFSVDWHETLRRFDLPTKEDQQKVQKIYLREIEKLGAEISLFPGITTVLDQLGNFKLAVLSNNERHIIEKNLKRNNIDCFQSILGGDDGKQKPDPELFIMTMKRLGVKPEEVIYVCDMKEEIDGARKAYIKEVIAVTYGYHSKEHLMDARPPHLADTPAQILEVIEKIHHG